MCVGSSPGGSKCPKKEFTQMKPFLQMHFVIFLSANMYFWKEKPK